MSLVSARNCSIGRNRSLGSSEDGSGVEFSCHAPIATPARKITALLQDLIWEIITFLSVGRPKMFAHSTQKKFWLFADESELIKARCEANQRFIQKHAARVKVNPKIPFHPFLIVCI